MASCTFIGRKDIPKEMELTLKVVLAELIEHRDVKTFYVGNNGGFDAVVKAALEKFMVNHRDIECITVPVTKYIDEDVPLPKRFTAELEPDYEDILDAGGDLICQEDFAELLYLMAMRKRNAEMIRDCEYLVAYAEPDSGGVASFIELADKLHKIVFNLIDFK